MSRAISLSAMLMAGAVALPGVYGAPQRDRASDGCSPPRHTTGRIDAHAFRCLLHEAAKGWTSDDAGRASAAFAKDAIYSEPGGKQLYRGRAALFRFFGGPSGRTEPIRMTWHHVSFDADSQVGAGEFTFSWPGGHSHGMVSVRIRNGLIANWREYFVNSPKDWQAFQGANRF